jgi:hypothetical protein
VRVLRSVFPFILLALFISACAGQQKELLARNYTHMSNDELLKYYYLLTDEISRCVNESHGTSVGVGTGFGLTRWLGLGVGVSHGLTTCNPDKLRQRRIDVRIELNHRGLNP